MDDAERTLLVKQCERRILNNSNNFAKLHRKLKRATAALAAAEARATDAETRAAGLRGTLALVRYVDAAMRGIEYQMVGRDRSVFAIIPGFDGLWASGATQADAREDMVSALEGWLWLGVYLHHRLPIVDGIDLNPVPPVVVPKPSDDTPKEQERRMRGVK